ncbi:bifunctional methionine sulfoxide reductase B/A protein [Myxococcota bacterium]|nr:bifunctional methionine sulfoxide reductase B/A protein [Myxococcota bacterium]MBU1429530.1 bifunctional methionine sulfoxide reductase B/A protein [Myxococcota bacterium]
MWKQLSPEAAHVIEQCGTERPFSGEFVHHKADGTYTCARCGAPLFPSKAKFDSRSGWPSFDDALPGAVLEKPDADGARTEIVCARCAGHLGHVFRGEGFTSKDTRHCVNSVSLGFTPAAQAEAYFAGGCFWGVEYYLEQQEGVLSVESGYMGGRTSAPTYHTVSSGLTGHAETVRVVYEPSKVSYEQLARLFFEIHDPTQVDRQGPDVGDQYRSAIFVRDASERAVIEKLVAALKAKGLKVATEIGEADRFWPAEAYHQDYYQRSGKTPYCHQRVNRF